MQCIKKNNYKPKYQRAFTLLEVLISIGLLGIVIVALFSTVQMMRDSNAHLYSYLQKAKIVTQSTQVLYLDILNSDGNITIKKDEFSRLCMEETRNSFYALSLAKVCWVVLKKDNTLARIEGNNYQLPTRFDDRVEVNPVMKHMEIFDVYHEKDKVLVFLKQKGKEPLSFLIQGVNKPRIKVTTKTKDKTKPTNNRPQNPNDLNNTTNLPKGVNPPLNPRDTNRGEGNSQEEIPLEGEQGLNNKLG
jgi:prepilin-type N-terminal cleavage/methylation domain-containing protein